VETKLVPSLEELKERVEKHLANELDILEMILQTDDPILKDFYNWYASHPYRKGIQEVREIVERR
jgi:hypothetical protein